MLLTNAHIHLEHSDIPLGWLKIEGSTIHSYGTMDAVPADSYPYPCEGLHLMPGFIDQHSHGNGGIEYMHADKTAWPKALGLLAKEGVTSFLPTTSTAPREILEPALARLGGYCSRPIHGLPQPLGIHLEGPFLNAQYIGAQNPGYLLPPSLEFLHQFYTASGGAIRLITFAPELVSGPSFFEYLRKNNIIPSAGHSAASFAQIEQSLRGGLKCLTHFHNASSPHHHRSPGVVSAGLMFDELSCELILDGVHLHPDAVRLVHKVKGPKGIILITDSLGCKGLPDGAYLMDGIEVLKKDGEIRMAQGGALAGSILALNKAAANYRAFTGASLRDLMQVCSENPARLLGFWHRKGSIALGKDADLILCDENISIKQCFCRGVPAL